MSTMNSTVFNFSNSFSAMSMPSSSSSSSSSSLAQSSALSSAPTAKRHKKNKNKASRNKNTIAAKTVRKRQSRQKPKASKEKDKVVTVLFNGSEHRLMVPASLAKSMKQASSVNDNKKKTKTKSKKNKSISKKQEKTLKKESKTMLPEERAFQLSLPEQQEAMQVDDVSHSPFCVERKNTMLHNIKYISKRLQVQGFALEEEQAYQNLVQPYDSFLRKKVELNLAAMKRQVERDELPTEEAYRALMDEAALFMAHG